jgi:acetyl esterase/lipase
VLWAYSGNRRFADDAAFVSAMSVVDHVTDRFPATFLTVGNADPLLSHSLDLEARLRALGVDVETRFFDADHEPPLGHEYQFAIDLADAQDTLARIVEFARRRT